MTALLYTYTGGQTQIERESTWYAEHKLMILGQLRPGEFKGGYATTYGGCLA
eukprot:COSAG02_NODE_46143_length_351_cov_0.972222_1_plen_51_part_01